jgi:hypothetical protein
MLTPAELHAVAITTACRDCHATIGELCRNTTIKEHPTTHIPHPKRLRDAEEVPF